MAQEILKDLYREFTGCPPDDISELSSSGSNRKYFRLTGFKNVVGVSGTSCEENKAFFYMASHFRQKGLPVPEVYCISKDSLYYLQEDLGDTLLFDAIGNGRKNGVFDETEKELLHKTIRLLPKIQVAGADGMDFCHCYPLPEFNRRSIFWDLNYFKYCFLKTTGLDFQENHLEDDFQKMADVLLLCSTGETFMYRDFQSRNVMIRDNEPWFIDFQGGRRGPVYYDVASFLWQAKANYPEDLREELLEDYISVLKQYIFIEDASFRRQLRHFVLFRLLQVLGAYGFRGYFERKPHFIQSVPYAINNLRQLLREDFAEYPYLCAVLRDLVQLPQFSDNAKQRLEVKIISFSYKKGVPEDSSGNGGGFVFDCRAINNPGKYERYNSFTGLDTPVIRFLEEDGEITTFLQHVYMIVDASVKRYMERGFSNLMVCFGCTGGQHRSVYSAQQLAEHLSRKFGVKIHLVHREQNIEQIFNPAL